MTSNNVQVAERDTDLEVVEQTAEEAMIVGKPFNSEYRRHHVDDPITRADLEKSRLDFDHLIEQGFIVPAATTRDIPEHGGEKGPPLTVKDKEQTR